MKQAWKRLLIAFSFVFLVTLLFAVFAACNNDDEEQNEEKTTYSITVLLPSNSPAVGIKFTFTKADGGDFLQEYTTDDEGKITAELPEDNYLVSAVKSTLPAGYTVADLYTVNFRGLPQTVKLVPAPSLVNYSFKVTGPAGAPLESIAVLHAATVTGTQSLLGQTNAAGTLDISVSAIEGFVFITPPEGYEYNRNYSGNTVYKISKTGGSVTFDLLKNNRISSETLMTNEEKVAFNQAIGSDNFQNVAIDKGVNSYTASTTLAAGETQYFVFRPLVTGMHTLYVNKTTQCEVNSLGNTYNTRQVLDGMSASKSMGMGVNCTAMQDCVFSVKSKSAERVQFVIVAPPESNNYSVTQPGQYDVQIKEDLPAVVAFRPSVQGQYKYSITTQGEFNTVYANETYTEKEITFDIYDDNLYNSDSSGNLTSEKTGAEWIFTISTQAQSYPVDVTVKFERLGAPTPRKTTVVQVVEVKNTLTSFGEQQGTLTAVGVYDTSKNVIKGSDGNYHLNSESGPLVVVQLKGVVPRYFDVDFELLDGNGGRPYLFDVTSDADRNDPVKPYVFHNYAKFLRGYLTFGTDQSGNLTAGTPEGEYYLKYVNSDGVYPLNDELKTFLELCANSNRQFWGGSGFPESTPDSLWLFSAFYYNEGSNAPLGTSTNPYPLSDGYEIHANISGTDGVWAALTATEDGIYTISFSAGSGIKAYSDSTLTNAFGTANLILKENESVIFYLVTEAGGSVESVTVNVAKTAISPVQPTGGDGTQDNPFVIGGTGIYKTEFDSEGIYYVISAPGNYTIVSSDKNAAIYVNNVLSGEGDGFTVNISVEGSPVVFSISTVNGQADTLYFEVTTTANSAN